MPIIKSKLIAPDLPTVLVSRPRLSSSIAQLITEFPVVEVTATAGAGKTTAAREAIELLPFPAAWLAIEEAEAAPGRLLGYVEAALATVVPEVEGIGTRALAAGAPHGEAAGLLLDAAADTPVVLVLDQLERLSEAPDALALISALLRYAPPALRVVMISRRDLAFEIHSTGSWTGIVRVDETDLAFTLEETTTALELHGRDGVDPVEAVAASGGWVTGVLFEAWRAAGHVHGAGGSADPLHGYLANQILVDLDPADRSLLVHTAVLEEVTAERAEALGAVEAQATIDRLRQVHLPVVWIDDGRALRLHPRFREYLVTLLGREPEPVRTDVRTAYARLLVEEGNFEDATDEFLALGLEDEALHCAEIAAPRVVERLDFAVAERWLAQLEPGRRASSRALIMARVKAALAREEYAEAARVSDELLELLGEGELISSELGSMIAWCYFLVERYEDCERVKELSEPGTAIAMFSWAFGVEMLDLTHRYEEEPPASGTGIDAVALRIHWSHGRFDRLFQGRHSTWVDAVQRPWRAWSLIALGSYDEALLVAEEVDEGGWRPVFFDARVLPELLLSAGRTKEAWRANLHGRDRVAATGSGYFKALTLLLEARMALRLDRDTAHGHAVLEQVSQLRAAHRVVQIMDELACWKGLALLLGDENEAACEVLREAMARVTERDRMLHAPTIGVYLAEAEWRAGHEEASDAAAELALSVSRRLGSTHLLSSALEDFPAVAARRIDAEPAPDGEWHTIGRAVLRRNETIDLPIAPAFHLQDFGQMAVHHEGELLRPRIAKSVELLVFLHGTPERRASRTEILDALFDGRGDASTRSYLRQAIGRLREVLPPDCVFSDAKDVWLGEVDISTDFQRLSQAALEASKLTGRQRLERFEQALMFAAAGEYLEDGRSEWATTRRGEVERIVSDLRQDTAGAAFEAGAYGRARDLVEAVLEDDPFREEAWRLKMRLLDALGDGDGLVSCFRDCERVLGEAGLSPAPGTRQLLTQLRR